ncbi:hypothetical protein AXF42_Ash011690 [Apostasia shenzhenica]|uniref:Coiled-coil domain-containing protein R3HCC1L n=1 Tax=Apostasia shenzhenica TaxID=1088818 RepID=A0A2H9ZUQ3_9ASPA|nr:hypothetical protein AXF42_Ash011690 [Apostasia shenzhenica]
MAGGDTEVEGWGDAVEDLVDKGDVDEAISLLESVVLKLEKLCLSSAGSGDHLRLATALSDLAGLHSSRGFSLKADEIRSRALIIRSRSFHPPESEPRQVRSVWETSEQKEENGTASSSNKCQEDEDDWEALADLAASSGEVLFSAGQEEAAGLDTSWMVAPSGAPRRRGRGSFLYRKDGLYSDQVDNGTMFDNSGSEDEEASAHTTDEKARTDGNLRYGTNHVLVLYDFPPITRTIQLEKLFDRFRDHGVSIRWINDTVALAVFRTPSIAHEALNSIHFPFKARRLEEDDVLLAQVSPRDLEPPFPRPKTSASTAQRLIAHGMGIKPSNNAELKEFRKQEATRKNLNLKKSTDQFNHRSGPSSRRAKVALKILETSRHS